MKILDLLERQVETQIEPNAQYNKALKRSKGEYGNDFGTSKFGTFARVAASKTDPFMVVKNDRKPSMRPDNYNRYIHELIKRGLMDTNIHFPRVYNIQKIEDVTKRFIFKYVIEKLIHWDELTDHDIEGLHRIVCEEPLPDGEDTSAYKWSYYYNAIIKDVMDEVNYGTGAIKLKSLKQAIGEIKEISKAISRPVDDVGGDNIMFRRTSHGVQLVITDPFYN